MVYLDHNATTPLRPEVLEAMLPYLTERYGNASSVHRLGREAREAVESARATVAGALGVAPTEVFFTSGGTESINWTLRGVVEANSDPRRTRIVTTQIEHHAVLETAQWLQKQGVPVVFAPVDRYGHVDLDRLAELIDETTLLVSVMHANNETGTIQPIREIAALAHQHGALFHTDAVQTVGKLPIHCGQDGIDLLSLSAHKFYGPKGVGALIVRTGVPLARFHHGGAHERNRRAGTENVPGIVGLGEALRLAVAEQAAEAKRLRALTEQFLTAVRERVPGVVVNSPEDRLPGTVNLSFEGVDGEFLIFGLDLEGICVSTGSACSSGTMEPSHVLRAMGVPEALARGTIRFSFGAANTPKEVEYTVEVLERLVRRSRQVLTRAAVKERP